MRKIHFNFRLSWERSPPESDKRDSERAPRMLRLSIAATAILAGTALVLDPNLLSHISVFAEILKATISVFVEEILAKGR